MFFTRSAIVKKQEKMEQEKKEKPMDCGKRFPVSRWRKVVTQKLLAGVFIAREDSSTGASDFHA